MTMKNILIQSLGVLVHVFKTRNLYIYNSTRIHIDDVSNLGHYIEFEYTGADDNEGKKEIEFLIHTLNLQNNQIEGKSYSDLLIQTSCVNP